MKVKRLLMVALAACLGVCTLFAGCDRSNSGAGENGTLKITYYKGGTGRKNSLRNSRRRRRSRSNLRRMRKRRKMRKRCWNPTAICPI